MLDEATAPLLQREVICSDFNHLEEFFFQEAGSRAAQKNRTGSRGEEAAEGFPIRDREIHRHNPNKSSLRTGQEKHKSPPGCIIPAFSSQVSRALSGISLPRMGWGHHSWADQAAPKIQETPR